MNTAPRRVLSDELTRAEKWTPWPWLLEAERPVPIEEPPTETFRGDEDRPANFDEDEPDEDDDDDPRTFSYEEFLEKSEGIKNP
jgi:hypothetical protein